MRFAASTVVLALPAALAAVTPLAKRENSDIGGYVYGAMSDEQTTEGSSGEEGSSPCQMVASAQAAILEDPDNDIYSAIDAPLNARLAYQCARSVEFVPEDGLQFIDYVRQYMPFLVTMPWLVDAPDSYQMPSIDIMSRLDEIEAMVNAGDFTSQYDFEYMFFQLEREVHDTHFNFGLGVIRTLFTWKLPYSLTTVSSDGQELPKVYVWQDVMENASNSTWTASAIETIEGRPAVEYLATWAINNTRPGQVESHADWSVIMANPAYSFNGGSLSLWQEQEIFIGDSVRGTFENGSDFEWHFEARTPYMMASEGMDNITAIYESLVLAVSPTTTTMDEIFAGSSSKKTKRQANADFVSYDSVPFANYPSDPVVKEEPFNEDPSAGQASGYILEAESIGVLSLPSFAGHTTASFGKVVSDFIEHARDARVERIVIDVSGNGGGSHFLAFDTFRRFFPELYPFNLLRAPAIPAIDTIGSILTPLITDEFGIVPREVREWSTNFYGTFYEGYHAGLMLDEQGEHFPTWSDYFGPIEASIGTNVTRNGQFNFKDDDTWFGGDSAFVFNFANNTADADVGNGTQRFSAEDIVIVADGLCGSTCQVFGDLMKNVAGVRFVSVGGAPTFGPMQPMSGSRGGLLTWEDIDMVAGYLIDEPEDAELRDMQDELYARLGSDRDALASTLPPRLADMRYSSAGNRVSHVDAIRPDSDVPQHLHYEPADCRLFFTAEMVRDITRVWTAAAKVLDGDWSACVRGSTDQRGARPNSTMTESPGFDSSFENWRAWADSEDWGSANRVPGAGNLSATNPSPTPDHEVVDGGEGGDGVEQGGAAAARRAGSFFGLVVALAAAFLVL